MLSEASSCLGRDSQGKPGTLLLAPASGPPRGPAITTQHPCPHHQVEVLLPLPKPGLPGHQRNLAVIPNQELDASIFTTMHHSPLGCPSIAPASWNIITAVHPQVLKQGHTASSLPLMRPCEHADGSLISQLYSTRKLNMVFEVLSRNLAPGLHWSLSHLQTPIRCCTIKFRLSSGVETVTRFSMLFSQLRDKNTLSETHQSLRTEYLCTV